MMKKTIFRLGLSLCLLGTVSLPVSVLAQSQDVTDQQIQQFRSLMERSGVQVPEYVIQQMDVIFRERAELQASKKDIRKQYKDSGGNYYQSPEYKQLREQQAELQRQQQELIAPYQKDILAATSKDRVKAQLAGQERSYKSYNITIADYDLQELKRIMTEIQVLQFEQSSNRAANKNDYNSVEQKRYRDELQALRNRQKEILAPYNEQRKAAIEERKGTTKAYGSNSETKRAGRYGSNAAPNRPVKDLLEEERKADAKIREALKRLKAKNVPIRDSEIDKLASLESQKRAVHAVYVKELKDWQRNRARDGYAKPQQPNVDNLNASQLAIFKDILVRAESSDKVSEDTIKLMKFNMIALDPPKDANGNNDGYAMMSRAVMERLITVDYDELGNMKLISPKGSDKPINFQIANFNWGDGNFDFKRFNPDASAYASNGVDHLSGDKGDNTFLAMAGDDYVYGNRGHDTLFGEAGDDRIWGGAGRDVLYGGDDNDMLTGGAGDDRLEGGKGIDRLIGGAGKDTLVGGPGIDRFVVHAAHGKTIIEDFERGEIIEVSMPQYKTAQSILDVASVSGSDVVIKFSAVDKLTLKNTKLSDLTKASFVIANP